MLFFRLPNVTSHHVTIDSFSLSKGSKWNWQNDFSHLHAQCSSSFVFTQFFVIVKPSQNTGNISNTLNHVNIIFRAKKRTRSQKIMKFLSQFFFSKNDILVFKPHRQKLSYDCAKSTNRKIFSQHRFFFEDV